MGNEWLQNLKVGDEVFVGSGSYGVSKAIIDKVTATQIAIGNRKYRKKDGYEIGSTGYSRPHLMPITDEWALSKILQGKCDRQSYDVGRIDFSRQPYGVLQEVSVLLAKVLTLLNPNGDRP